MMNPMLRMVYHIGFALKLTRSQVLAMDIEEFVHWVVYLKKYAPKEEFRL